MKYLIKLLIFSLAIQLFSGHATGKEKVSISSYPLPGNILNQDGTGFFVDLLDYVFKDSNYQYKLNIFPIRRCIDEFYKKKHDLLFSHMEGKHGTKYHESILGFEDGLVYFSHKDLSKNLKTPSVRSLLSITNYALPESSLKKVKPENVVRVHNYTQFFKMLSSKRADLGIGFRFLAFAHLSTQPQPNIYWEPNAPFTKEKVVALSHKTKKGKKLSSFLSQRIKQSWVDGTFRKLMKKHKIPFWLAPESI